MKAISKANLCKLFGLSYKTLALRLKSIEKKIHYSSKNIFSPKEFELIKQCLGDPNQKSITKKELKQLQGVSYKVLAGWLIPVFGEEEYKKRRYFSPSEFNLIAEEIGLPFQIYTDENDVYYIRDVSLLKGKEYDEPQKWGAKRPR
jgi:uncharacterized protein YfkK (UPF0435 family)